MKKVIIVLGMFLFIPSLCFGSPEGSNESDSLPQLPIMECQITSTIGSFFGYAPPEVGQKATFDFNKIAEIKNITFSGGVKGTGYIPLSGAFKHVKTATYSNGAFQKARYIAEEESESWKVTLDVGTKYSDQFYINVLGENRGWFDSFTSLACINLELKKSEEKQK